MSNIVYTVQIGEDDYISDIKSPKKATELAIRTCKENPGEAVFVSWFRAADQCHGFLNRDGNHEAEGRNWQK